MSNLPIKLVVGLGNPGREYESTRHNAGFWFVDALARELGASFNRETKFHGEVAKAGGVWLLKPTTFMNRSGQAVGALAKFFQITPAEIMVAHDEMDLPAGGVKMKIGGSAGSNGIKDIVNHLGSKEFWRLRLGIGHPRELAAGMPNKLGGVMDRPEVVDYVLHRPGADEQRAIDEVITQSLDCWTSIAKGDMEAAMLRLHTKPKHDIKTPKAK
ncbi:MAG: aminoacyl-tRNA hydrolase [Betaproteobacteria bacterium]|jgi:PTH1 family peptidyl-tRNA hydrolase|nr:peptidyl-tRNA hydrolase [Betaproteobacteria bacterium UKL13-2]HCG52393.1 aminoacyl-tRNA hydrolase [Betaproteobacteria bacterium]